MLRDELDCHEDYGQAKNVWNEFKIKKVGDYHDLYLRRVCNMCLKDYELDPCRYFNNPRLTWDDMPDITGAKSNLISDTDLFQFIEKRIREGVS